MTIITIGIDLAKNIFAVHGVNENGHAELVKPKVSRDQLLPLIANLPPCLIGMEACTGAHHWARLFREDGHTIKLMAPKFVTPYRMSGKRGKRGKNDAQDAAVTRPHMHFVPIKEEHQQIILCLHRTRQGFVAERTATYNRMRGLISEFGIVLPQKVTGLRQHLGRHLNELPGYARQCIDDLLSHADQLDARITTKAGDSYLRSLLVMGARAVLNSIGDKQDYFSCWARDLVARHGYWRAVVAIAAKDARVCWAVLKYGEDFRLNKFEA